MFLWLTNHHKNPWLNRLFISVQLNLWLWITFDHDFPNTSSDGNSNEWKLYHRTLLALNRSYALPVTYSCSRVRYSCSRVRSPFMAAFVTRRITLQTRCQPDQIRKMIIIFIFYYLNASTFEIDTEWWMSIWWRKFKYGHLSR